MTTKEDYEARLQEVEGLCMEAAVNEGLEHIMASVESIVDEYYAEFESEEDRKKQIKYLLACILAECKAINMQLRNMSWNYETCGNILDKIEAL